jgi:hypothetical protein
MPAIFDTTVSLMIVRPWLVEPEASEGAVRVWEALVSAMVTAFRVFVLSQV